jgi:hypothetical protein
MKAIKHGDTKNRHPNRRTEVPGQKLKVEPRKLEVEPRKLKVEPQKLDVEPRKLGDEPVLNFLCRAVRACRVRHKQQKGAVMKRIRDRPGLCTCA